MSLMNITRAALSLLFSLQTLAQAAVVKIAPINATPTPASAVAPAATPLSPAFAATPVLPTLGAFPVVPTAPEALAADPAAAAAIEAASSPAAPAETPKSPDSSLETASVEASRTFDGANLNTSGSAEAVAASPSSKGATRLERPGSAEQRPLPQTLEKPLPGDPLQVTVHRLSNGMTVYLSPNRQEPRVHFEIAVRAGSRHDPLEATGMAHYLEHMQFKGTERLGTSDYAKEKPHLDRITTLYDQLFQTKDPEQRKTIYAEIDRESQAAAKYAIPNEFDRLYSATGFTKINAHTSYDETSYEGSFPTNRAEVWARTENDRLSNPVYRIFLPELEAVYEEYNRGQDNPDMAFSYAGPETLFQGHPYSRDIIGLGEHLKNPSLSRMREFFLSHYRPNNMAILLSGDFDRQEMLKLVEKNFGALKPAPIPAPPAGAVQAPRGVERHEMFHQAEERVQIGWLLPGHNHPDEDALTLMAMLMDNKWTGILNLSVNKAQKVKDSEAYPYQLNEAGGFFMLAAPKEGQTLEQAEQVLLDAVAKLKAGEFSEADIKAVITDLEVQEKKRLEKNEDRVGLMTEAYIHGEEWAHASGRQERLKKITKADILRVAERYLGNDRVVIYRRKGLPNIEKVSKPAFTPVPIDSSRQSAFFKELTSLPAKPMAPRFLREGRDYRTLDRAWGRLYSTKNPVNDLFTLEFRFDLGVSNDARLEPAFKLLKLSGAGKKGIDEFQKELYRLGSTMKMGCGDQECVVQLSGREKNLSKTLKLALQRFSHPKISAGAFGKMIDVERGARQDRKLEPEEVFRALKESATRGKDSSVLKELSPERLDALTEKELVGVLDSVFDHKRSVLYTGNRKAEEVAKILSSAQGRRRYKPTPEAKPVKISKPSRSRVVFVHREGMKQAMIGASASDGPLNPAEVLDQKLYNAMMGGMNGVYFQEVRESRALAYDAQGGYKTGERSGDDNALVSYAGTQADKAIQAAQLLKELMQHAPVTPERFEVAKRTAEEFYRTVVLPNDVPKNLLAWQRLGLSADPRAKAFEGLKSYDRARLEAFAKRFDKPLTFYVLADRNQVDLEGLKKLGNFEELPTDALFPY